MINLLKPIPVRSLQEYLVLIINEFRYFSFGLPNLKRYYDERGHYPAYYVSFQYISRGLSSKGVPVIIRCVAFEINYLQTLAAEL